MRYNQSMTTNESKHHSSDALILKNNPGITDPSAFAEAESQAYMIALETLIGTYHGSYTFTAADVQAMHSMWLGGLYEGTGDYRKEDMSSGDLHYAPARQVPKLMEKYEKTVLAKHTPCNSLSAGRMLQALAVVHAELVLIHPFQYGTERVAMMLTTLMALQAGMPILNFQDILTSKSEEYADALKSALHEDYDPIKILFEQVVAASVRSCRRGRGNDS